MYQVIAALAVLAALAALVAFRRAARERDADRAEMARLRRDAAAHAYNENQVSARLAAVGQAALDPILICKADHTVIYLNPAAADLFGASGPANPSLIALTRRHELDELAAAALAGSDDLDRQLFIDGRTYRARAAAFPGGAALLLTDLSELQRLGRARRDFIANISHELRTPLTAIRLLTDTLKSPAGRGPDVALALVDKIAVEIEALSQLAQELLDLSAIESGQVMMKLVAAPLRPALEGPVQRLAELAAKKNLLVAVECDAHLMAWMDSAQVERAVLNLLHNAIKFTPAGGQIWLRADSAPATADPRSGQPLEGRWLRVQVQDTGQGLAPEDLPRIFERFYRAERSRASGGTGLGLAIAKHIVEAHGGRIWAESDGAPGRGATFTLLLPAVE